MVPRVKPRSGEMFIETGPQMISRSVRSGMFLFCRPINGLRRLGWLSVAINISSLRDSEPFPQTPSLTVGLLPRCRRFHLP
jgi:hypothetical protein